MQPICLLQQAPTTPFVTSLSESRREGGKGGVLSPLINSEISPITSSPCSLAIAAPAQTSISETDFTASNPRELEFSQGPSQEMELSWQGYYNPSRLWEDNRMIQVNGEVPAFSLQDSLWIEGPTLVETLEPDEEEIKEAFGSEASDGRAKQGVAPILENPALKGKLPWFKSGFKCGVHVDVSKEQLQDHVSFWDTLSLEEALSLLDQTDELPSIDSSVCILQKSRKKKNLVFAKRAHAHVCHNGLEAHAIVGNYIVPMFVECGSVVNAQQVFNRLVHRNEHTWTSLVLGYIQCGKLRHALDLYEEMMEDNVHPSSYTLVALVQACAKLKDVRRGAELHVEITQIGLERDPFVGSSLIDLYGKCGLLPEARDVFEELPVRGIVSWNALIAGYAEHGASQEVLKCIQQMQLEDITPDAVTYSCSLKACGSMGNIEKVQQLHIEIAQDGFETDLPVGNSMIGMYAKCGSLSEAQEVFDTLPARDDVSWNALITGYAEHGPVLEVLNFFEKMSFEGISPNAATFACTLRACGGVGTLGKGQEIHSEIVQKGLERDLSVGNSLVGMYTKFGLLSEAEKVFGKMLIRDAVSWTALIAGYAEHGADQESLKYFEQMQLEGLSPDAVTYTCILKACGNIGAVDRGRELCREIARKGFKRDLRVGNSLIGMYVKCGLLSEAREIFDEMPVRNVVSWTTLITGYADNGAGQEGLQLFKQMQLDGVSPNDVTLAAAFKSCGGIGALDKGQEIHAQVAQDGYERDELVCSSLVCMYAKCGLLSEAGELIDVSPIQNIVSWNALLSGYAEHGPGKEALQWFEKMQEEGVFPDAVTYSCILKACASVGAIDIGRELHRDILQRGLERDSSLGNSLISMYSKCGSLSEAQEIFDTLAVQDVVAWSSMIIGYGVNHEGKMALQCFDDMQEQGVKPDSITFTRLLTACSHAGLVLEGQEYLKIMREDYGIPPTVEHFTSMVDLLARSGHLYEAEMFIEKLCPYSEVTWGALLSACKTYGEAELGLRCFHQLVEINSKAAAWYVLMADIHAGAGSWDSAYRIEELRKHAGTKKKPGSALIEVNKKAYEFIAGNNQSKEVLDRLTLLSSRLKEEGHRPHLALVLKPISDEEKEVALCEHAEKLAIAFGLVNTPQGETLRLTKNLRMCNDCHDASKIISRIERREIILRDECCMHHFKDGACSCGDMF